MALGRLFSDSHTCHSLSPSHLCPGQSHLSNLTLLVTSPWAYQMAPWKLCVAREIHVEASSWAALGVL